MELSWLLHCDYQFLPLVNSKFKRKHNHSYESYIPYRQLLQTVVTFELPIRCLIIDLSQDTQSIPCYANYYADHFEIPSFVSSFFLLVRNRWYGGILYYLHKWHHDSLQLLWPGRTLPFLPLYTVCDDSSVNWGRLVYDCLWSRW